MPAIDTRKYRTSLTRRFQETLVNKETYEALLTTFESFLANTASSNDVRDLINEIGTTTSHLYLAIGRPVGWTNDNTPPSPDTDTQAIDYTVWRDMLAAKRIESATTSYVIPRRDWANNTLYIQYDDTVADIANSNIYVLDTQTLPYRVYKCLWNNRGANSTVAPSTTGNTVTPVTTADGYVWQYMYTVAFDDYPFLTDTWMPVKTDALVRTSAEATQGQLSTIVPLIMTSNGGDFNPAGTFIVSFSGDGNGAVISPNSTSLTFATNTITGMMFSNGGLGYSATNTATVYQATATANATARAIIPPYPNHGYDPQIELGGSALMITTVLEDDELDKLTTTNEYRRIMLLSDPQTANGGVANAAFYRQTFDLYLSSNTGPFSPDDVIYVSNNTEFEVTATVVDTLSDGIHSAVVRVTSVNDKGRCACHGGDAFASGDEITNSTVEGSIGVISAVVAPELKPFTGEVLYIDQREPVTRTAQQSEEIKLVFRFD
jgi:hypothetical protein